MPTLTEPEIIQKAIAGDMHAFRSLVEKYQALAVSLSCRFLGNKSDAEDITQEAFVRLWKNLPRYKTGVKLSTWLYKIVTNLCLDFLKSKHSRQSRNTASVDSYYAIADPSITDGSILTDEFRTIILKMTETLTPKQKAVFILRDLEELSMQEVSEILSTSSGNVKSNLYYARVKMSELIKKYYQEQKKYEL